MSESKLRISATRLAVEGVVIVASILLAFAIDAWWESTQERSKDLAYLDQLESDLQSTLSNIATFGGRADAADLRVAALVRAYYEAEPPPVDSLVAWWPGPPWVVQPTLGTVEALVSTGDLAVIRHSDLRAQLPNYLKTMLAFEEFEANGHGRYRQASYELRRLVNPRSVRIQRLTAAERDSVALASPGSGIPAGALRPLPHTDLLAAVRDPEVHYLLDEMRGGQAGMRTNRDRMRSATEELLMIVREAKGDRAAGPR